MEGRLREEPLVVEIETSCAHCGAALHLAIDDELRAAVSEPDASPLVFEPSVDWERFTAPNIIHDY